MKARITIAFLLCAALLFSLCACGASTTETQGEFANKDQFLKDMAKGISSRLNYVDDSKTRTDEEMAIYYQELVSLELEQIEKYEAQTFADSSFDELAHAYIDACQMQRIMAQNYRNKNLQALWNSASTIRSTIISEMYTYHNLPISSEEAANYSSQNSGNVQYSASLAGDLDLETGLTMYSDNMVTYDPIVLDNANNQVLFARDGIKITLKSLERKDGQYTINMTISNNLPSDKVACYLAGASVDDYQISMYHPWGYNWSVAGKKCDTYSNITEADLKDIGSENFKKLSAYLYVITTDGSTGQYIAKVPLTIDRSLFS